jgi:predicted NAD/FAD-dependent oxidoreductase
MNIVIIGAGLSGLIAAQLLSRKNLNVIIIEKSKGIGGRLATRRINNESFDHGTSFFNEQFSKELISFDEKLKPFIKKVDDHFYFEGGMNQLGKKLAEGLEIKKMCRIINLKFNHQWELTSLDQEILHADKIILAIPMPQASELLKSCDKYLYEKTLPLNYSKALVGLFNVKNNLRIKKENDSLVCQSKKNLALNGIVYYFENEKAEKYFDEPDSVVLEQMIQELSPLEIISSELKKWRYSKPIHILDEPYLKNKSENLFIIGDSFLNGQLIGAIQCAQTMVQNEF